jgi:hypothetical protein
VDFDVIHQRLVAFATLGIYCKRTGYNGTIHQLFIGLNDAYNSVRKGSLI